MNKVILSVIALFLCTSLRAANFAVDVGPSGNNFRFVPADITINVGDTVVWTARSSGHDVSGANNAFRSARPMPVNSTFSHTFTTAGNFSYVCSPHVSFGMTGIVRVNAAPVNQLPTVNLTAPANGASFTTGQQITISADAADPDGTIASVEFFDGSTSLGLDTSAPYSITVTLPQGAHTLIARATDNLNAAANSSSVSITVDPPANQPPAVSITSPAHNSSFTAGQTVTITATASDPDGTVTQVQFFQNGNLLGSDAQAPYEFSFTPGQGTHSLVARATDNSGATSDSPAITINVQAVQNQPPTISFASPAAGAVFAEGSQVTFKADATDPEGQLARVEFSIGGSVASTDTAPPFEFTASQLALGDSTVTAVAIDAQGNQSAAVTLTVKLIVRPVINSLTRPSPTEVRIAATGTTGVPHTLQSTTDFTTWTDVATNSPGRGGSLVYTDAAAPEFRLYRVVVK